MKLSKKILTLVAPIATVVAVAPIITSCNNKSFDFTYGDSINCYAKDTIVKGDPKKLDKVQEAAKNHAVTWDYKTVTDAQLTAFKSHFKWVYYDLVASLAVCNNAKFAMSWKYTENTTTLEAKIINDTYKDGFNVNGTYDNVISYSEQTKQVGESTKKYIALGLNNGTNWYYIESYAFVNVTVTKA